MYRHLTIMALFTVLSVACDEGRTEQAKDDNVTSTRTFSDDETSIQLSGAFALYPMAVKWAEEFRKLNPSVRIDISAGGAGKGMTDVLSGVVDIAMVSREIYQVELDKNAYPFGVVKDAVVPTINSNNPLLNEIKRIGITPEKARKLWIQQTYTTWGEFLGSESRIPLHVYTRSDACGAAETFAAWFGAKQEDLKGTAVYGDPGVTSAIQKDRVGIGMNNMAYAYDITTKLPYKDITILPIDINENGIIDADEDFYANSETLSAAIADGRYPMPPARLLYIVTNGKPVRPEVIEFIRYILTDGQKFAAETGYVALSQEQALESIKKLGN